MTSIVVEPSQPPPVGAAKSALLPGWLRGWLATAVVIAGIEFTARTLYALPNPGVFLILAVVYTAFVGGLRPAGLAAAATLLFSAYHFSTPGQPFRYVDDAWVRLVSLAIALPAATVMVGLLRRRADRSTREALDRQRDAANSHIEASHEFNRAVLNSLPAHLAVIDSRGQIVAVNHAWQQFAQSNQARDSASCGIGGNYLDICRRARGDGTEDARIALEGIGAVLTGRQDRFTMEYPCHSPTERRWFLLTATPMQYLSAAGSLERGVVVSHFDISRRKLVEQRITELIKEMDEQRLRVQHLVHDVPGIVFEAYATPDCPIGRPEFVSNYIERMSGHPVQHWLEQPGFWLAAVHPDDRERVAAELSDAVSRGGGSSEFRWLRHDGRPLWAEARYKSIPDGSGESVGVRGVITNITKLKRAQQALRNRAATLIRVARQLKRSNSELDQFAYITSHDLRAPLRGIANLSRWIEEDMGDSFPPEAHKQMELLRGRVHRMEALIDGILQYSRVGRANIEPQLVDVGQLVREVVDLLHPPPGFRIELAADLPVVYAQRTSLQQVFMNLLGNAIKHHDKPQGCVRVGWRDAEGEYEFTVADDGPGIAPEYHERIFVIFQTLEPRDKVEGTGVGLSLVKKIVEHAGGRIRLESREGAGATFRFTWPKLKGEKAR